ncbi:transmembrane protein 243-like [Gigantopelta aegis]|uniref:transmembrane protein 243-like n=1 Tax=Gigantopelta aegis TaxID=1735272 RepID=UPI001B88A895|nr:transmembrane protein 243-like [Gigantopelta aegis]XP_041350120.1 transmembrane protein 243-like [Gigantopelta aegis]
MNSRQYDDPAEMPLFGERRPMDRVLNLIVGAFTAVVVLVTLISAIAFQWPPNGVDVFFACVIVLTCASHLFLIYWYRQGDLEPRFRTMIFYNAFTIILLCVCGNLYIYGLGCPNS